MRISLKTRQLLGFSLAISLISIHFTCLPLQAEIAHLPESVQFVLKNTWPKAKQISSKAYYLTKQKRKALLEGYSPIYHSPDEMGLIHTFYTPQPVSTSKFRCGYFDRHIVRSKGQILFFILDTQGRVQKIETVAFHEPAEYRAPKKWLKQFYGQRISNGLQQSPLHKGVDALSGATFTRRAVIKATEKVLLLHKIHIRNE